MKRTSQKKTVLPDSRVVLRLPSVLAPVKLAVLPLVRKDGLPDISRKIINEPEVRFQLPV